MTAASWDETPWAQLEYDILGELGRGGMGVIYLARHRPTGHEVAIKVRNARLDDPEDVIRFEREAQLLSELSHPHIVRIYDYGCTAGRPYMVIELLRGADLQVQLQERLKQGRAFEPEEVVAWLMPIVRALQYCHQRGVLHRDLKLPNIVIEEGTGRPVLVDFGLAKRASADSQSFEHTLSRTGEVLGTLAYLAPEQLDPSGSYGELGPPVDVWALGLVMHALLTGRLPAEESNPVDQFLAIKSREAPPHPVWLQPGLPAWIDELVADMLIPRADERPELSEILARMARQTGRFELSSGALPAVESPAERGVGGLWIGLALLLGLALGALGGRLFSGRSVPRLLFCAPMPAVTGSQELTIEGLVSDPSADLRVNDSRVLPDGDGRFSASLRLREGRNVVTIELAGQVAERCDVAYDAEPPEVTISTPEREGAWDLETAEGAPGLRGHVLDRSAVTLTANGRPVEVRSDGQFFIPEAEARRAEGGALALVARDAVGLEAVIARPLAPALLQDRRAWASADPLRLDRVISEVSERLAPRFRYVGTRDYSCNGLKHRIARFRHEQTGGVYHLIPGGEVTMGFANEEEIVSFLVSKNFGEDDARLHTSWATPLRRVRVPAMLVGQTELSLREWAAVEGENPYEEKVRDSNFPVPERNRKNVLSWLARSDGALRLPSEAEWEYACRAGATTRFFWGADFDGRYCWFFANSPNQPRPTRAHEGFENAFGLRDMLGNMFEVTADDFSTSQDPSRTGPEPMAQSAEAPFVIRGGSWANSLFGTLCSARLNAGADHAGMNISVRLVADIPPAR